MAQSLSDIRSTLAAFGLRPKHRLGQNFLHDGNQMARVVLAAGIETGDLVLEVGAGTGGLSQGLLDSGCRLVAVEIDRALAPVLQRALLSYGKQVTVVIGDALAGKHALNPDMVQALATAAEASPCSRPAGGVPGCFKLVANLPYQIASPLLANLLAAPIGLPRMGLAVVMVQREVADRLSARPGHKAYGALSVLVQAQATVERIAVVSPGCFWPSPKVDSALIRLRRLDKPLTDHPKVLGLTLARLFGQRRKQLGTILGRRLALPEGIDPHARPEQLTVEQLVGLSDRLDPLGRP